MKLSARARSGTLPVTLLVLILLAFLPLFSLDERIQAALALGLIYAIAGVSLDVFSGYGGQLTFGNFGFVAIGAYLSAVFTTQYHWSVWATIPLAVVVCAIVAALLGGAMIRLPFVGVALGSFFFAYVVVALISGPTLSRWTHGGNGIPVTELAIGTTSLGYGPGLFWFAWITLAVVVALSYRYANCRAGKALRAIKMNETVAASMGVNVFGQKQSAFVFAAAGAGLAGVVFAQSLGYLSPDSFGSIESIVLIAMVVVGGMGSIVGPILGAVFFTVVTEATRSTGQSRDVVFALLLLLALVFLPEGLIGGVDALWARIRRRIRRLRASTDGRVDVGVEVEGSEIARGTEKFDAVDGSTAQPTSTSARTHVTSPEEPARAGSDGGEAPLAVESVTVEFGGVRALDGVTVTVEHDTVHGIMGPNGAGKTTLLNCISGIQRYAGDIRLHGESIAGRTARRVRQAGVGRTFQNPSLVPDLTLRENVELGAYGLAPSSTLVDILPLPSTLRRDRHASVAAEEALDRVGFPQARRNLLASELTLAEQKMVDIARAIAGAPRLLLLDEPTAGLEHGEIDRIAEVINTFRRNRGLTVVVIAHHIGFLRDVADTATALDFGRVIAEGPPDSVTRREEVVAVFLGGSAAVN
ncbi:branched-chain amino acid ABC transporter ATP-binding protein/permease [Actinophytocola sp.]|uniref:branched-chain amino acid ABC transporter ATP-binding protein/permease n=1 Tax=Actinophytocola sp. TaxID=1872138 RepID=UPI003D6B1063